MGQEEKKVGVRRVKFPIPHDPIEARLNTYIVAPHVCTQRGRRICYFHLFRLPGFAPKQNTVVFASWVQIEKTATFAYLEPRDITITIHITIFSTRHPHTVPKGANKSFIPSKIQNKLSPHPTTTKKPISSSRAVEYGSRRMAREKAPLRDFL